MITINPDLFKVNHSTGRSSRKKRASNENGTRPEIKVRSTPKPKTNTLRSKNHVLRFIRDQQEKTYKKMIDDTSTDKTKPTVNSGTMGIIDEASQIFHSDFDESLKYMISLTDEQKQANDLKNRTLKQRPLSSNNIGSSSSLLFHPSTSLMDEVVGVSVPEVFNTSPYGPLISRPSLQFPQPKYGCMKTGGSLPTYRQYNKHNMIMFI
jgi:hypothetical protein